MTEEALLLAEQCNLTHETDSWVKNLSEMKEKITQLIDESGNNEIINLRNSLNKIKDKNIKGDDDKENIEFIKLLDSELMKGKDSDKSVETEYKKDPEKLINKRLSIVKNLHDSGNNELKQKKSWLTKILNKIKNKFKKKNKK